MNEIESLQKKVYQFRYLAQGMRYDLSSLDSIIQRFSDAFQQSQYSTGSRYYMLRELIEESKDILHRLEQSYGELGDMAESLAEKYEVILIRGSNPADNF